MPKRWTNRCPRCGMAIIIDSFCGIIESWPDLLSQYHFKRVAMCGGWECLGLENTVAIGSCGLEDCDAVYIGDLITQETKCPLCQFPVQDMDFMR